MGQVAVVTASPGSSARREWPDNDDVSLRVCWLLAAGVVGWRQKPEAVFNALRPRLATHWRTGVKLVRVS